MNTVLYYSNFGNATAPPNGHVVKSQQCLFLLQKLFARPVRIINSYRPMLSLLIFLGLILRSNTDFAFVSLGRKGIIPGAVIVAVCRMLRGRPPLFVYIVIGGWLYEYVNRWRILQWLMRRFDHVLVESYTLCVQLRALGILASEFPNVRSLSILAPKGLAKPGAVRLCFASRIRRDKGYREALQLASLVRKRGYNVSIDFYGPLETDREEFLQAVEDHPAARYVGQYSMDLDAVALFGGYDFLVLPTTYRGEGVPGVIVEAYCAGTPVICTDWMHLREVVRHGRTGFLAPPAQFAEIGTRFLLDCVLDPEIYCRLSAECCTEALKYSGEAAMGRLRALGLGTH